MKRSLFRLLKLLLLGWAAAVPSCKCVCVLWSTVCSIRTSSNTGRDTFHDSKWAFDCCPAGQPYTSVWFYKIISLLHSVLLFTFCSFCGVAHAIPVARKEQAKPTLDPLLDMEVIHFRWEELSSFRKLNPWYVCHLPVTVCVYVCVTASAVNYDLS